MFFLTFMFLFSSIAFLLGSTLTEDGTTINNEDGKEP